MKLGIVLAEDFPVDTRINQYEIVAYPPYMGEVRRARFLLPFRLTPERTARLEQAMRKYSAFDRERSDKLIGWAFSVHVADPAQFNELTSIVEEVLRSFGWTRWEPPCASAEADQAK